VASPEDKAALAAQSRLTSIQGTKPATSKLMDESKAIGSNPDSFLGRHPTLAKFVRPVAEIGSGLARGVETVGNIAVPGVMANIPGTEMNRGVRIAGAQNQLAGAEKNRLAAAGAEKDEAAATGATANTKMTADMAAKGYTPVTDAMGKTSWQFTGKGEEKVTTDDRKTLPDGTPNPNYGKSVYATLNPQGQAMSYGALAAEPNKPAAAPTKESDEIKYTGLDQALRTNPAGVSTTDRPGLAAYQRAQGTKGLNPEALQATTGQFPVPADYPKGYQDPQYQKDHAAWNNSYDKAFRGQPAQLEAQAKVDQGKQDKLFQQKNDSVKNYETVMGKNSDKIMNLQQAQSMLDDPNGMKDALVLVKALVATAGGMGSGVRITNAELQRISSSRGWSDTAGIKINNALDPANWESLSPAQREQLKGIVQDVFKNVDRKQNILAAGTADIRNAHSTDEINGIQNRVDKQVRAMERGKDYSESEVQKYATAKKMTPEAVRKSLDQGGWVEVPE